MKAERWDLADWLFWSLVYNFALTVVLVTVAVAAIRAGA